MSKEAPPLVDEPGSRSTPPQQQPSQQPYYAQQPQAGYAAPPAYAPFQGTAHTMAEGQTGGPPPTYAQPPPPYAVPPSQGYAPPPPQGIPMGQPLPSPVAYAVPQPNVVYYGQGGASAGPGVAPMTHRPQRVAGGAACGGCGAFYPLPQGSHSWRCKACGQFQNLHGDQCVIL